MASAVRGLCTVLCEGGTGAGAGAGARVSVEADAMRGCCHDACDRFTRARTIVIGMVGSRVASVSVQCCALELFSTPEPWPRWQPF